MSNVNTDGSAYVGGNVSIGGGKFVGRDEITHNYYSQPVSAGPLFVGVPAQPNNFVGRDELLEEIIQRLITSNDPALSFEGLPGVGKTTLAVAVAYHPAIRQHFSDGVLWASLGLQPDAMSTLAQWAQALSLNVSTQVDEASRAQAVKDAVGQRHLLIVIDDAWQLHPAQLLQVGGPNCRYLLTTRDKALARDFAGAAQMKRVPTLEEDPAFELLRSIAPEACDTDPQLSRSLVRAVGGLPLAVELLGGYLATPEHGTFPQLSKQALAELADPRQRLKLASRRLGAHQDVQVTLQDTITLSLSDLPKSTVRAFYGLGAFAPQPEVFSLAAAEAVTHMDAPSLALLISRNLITKGDAKGEALSLHQTVADAARTMLDRKAVIRHREFYVALARSAWPDWQQIETAYGQIKQAWQAAPEDAGLGPFLQAIGQYQNRRGLWRDHVAWANRALPIQEAVGDRAGLAITLNNLGMVYYSLGQPGKALDYFQRALPIHEEVGDRGERHTLQPGYDV